MKKNQTHTLSTAKRSPLMAAGATVALTAALAMGAPSTALADEAEPGDGNAAPNPDGQQQPVESNAQTETKTVPASVLDENAKGEITVTETTTESDPVVVTDEKKNADGSITITTTTTTVTEKDLTVEGKATTKTDGEVDIEGTPSYFAGLNEGDVIGDSGYTVTRKVTSEDGSAITVVLTKALDPTSGAIDAEELAKILGEGYTVEAGEDGSFIINGKEYIVSTNVDNTESTRAVTISLKKSEEKYVVSDESGEKPTTTPEESLEAAEIAAKEKAMAEAVDQAIKNFEAKYNVTVVTDAEGNRTFTYNGHTYKLKVTEMAIGPTTAKDIPGVDAEAVDINGFTVKAEVLTGASFEENSKDVSFKFGTVTVEKMHSVTIDAEVHKPFGNEGEVATVVEKTGDVVTKVVTVKENADGSVTETTYTFDYSAPTEDDIKKLAGDYTVDVDKSTLKHIKWTSEAVTTRAVSTEEKLDPIQISVNASTDEDAAKAKEENERNAKAALVDKIKALRDQLRKDNDPAKTVVINNQLLPATEVGSVTMNTTDSQIEAMVAGWTFESIIKEETDYSEKTPEEIAQALIGMRDAALVASPGYDKYHFNHVDVSTNGTLTVWDENSKSYVTASFHFTSVDISYGQNAEMITGAEENDGSIKSWNKWDSSHSDGGRWEFYMLPDGYKYLQDPLHTTRGTNSTYYRGLDVVDSYYKIVGEIAYVVSGQTKTATLVTYGYLGRSTNECGNAMPYVNSDPANRWYGYDLKLENIEIDKEGNVHVWTKGVFNASLKSDTVIRTETSDQGEGVAGKYTLTGSLEGAERGKASATYGSYKLWEFDQDAKAEDTAVRDLELVAKNTTATVKTNTTTITPDDPRPVPDPDPDPTPDPQDPDLPQTGDTLPMGAAGASAALAALMMALGLRRRKGQHERA